MALDPKAVSEVARLARLRVDASDTTALTTRLNSILDMVDQLQQADVADIQPLAHPLEISQPLREDKVTETDISERVLALAPATEAGCYLVPRVIE